VTILSKFSASWRLYMQRCMKHLHLFHHLWCISTNSTQADVYTDMRKCLLYSWLFSMFRCISTNSTQEDIYTCNNVYNILIYFIISDASLQIQHQLTCYRRRRKWSHAQKNWRRGGLSRQGLTRDMRILTLLAAKISMNLMNMYELKNIVWTIHRMMNVSIFYASTSLLLLMQIN
jgi:hypothetical protein